MLTLFLGAFFTNVAVAFAPHEPIVIWFGKELGVLTTAIVATMGTLAACWVDRRHLFPLILKQNVRPPHGLMAKMIRGFDRAPFVIIALSGLTPLPFWPFKVLAVTSNYPTSRFLAAVGAGRFPRYLLLAYCGRTLLLPPWALPSLVIALSAWGLVVHLRSEREP